MEVMVESLGGYETCTGSRPRALKKERGSFCEGHVWCGRGIESMMETEGRVGQGQGKKREESKQEHHDDGGGE